MTRSHPFRVKDGGLDGHRIGRARFENSACPAYSPSVFSLMTDEN